MNAKILCAICNNGWVLPWPSAAQLRSLTCPQCGATGHCFIPDDRETPDDADWWKHDS